MMNAKKADLKFKVRFSSQINGSHPLTFVESRWCSLHTMIATAINKNGGILQLFLNGISLHIRIFEFIKLQIKYTHRSIMIISFFSQFQSPLQCPNPLSGSIAHQTSNHILEYITIHSISLDPVPWLCHV